MRCDGVMAQFTVVIRLREGHNYRSKITMYRRISVWVGIALLFIVSFRRSGALLPIIANRYIKSSRATIPHQLSATASTIDVKFDGNPIETSFYVSTRDDTSKAIRHCELYSKQLWYSWFMQFLPSWWPASLRPKPCAKAGVRSYVTPSVGSMEDVIRDLYFNNRSSNDISNGTPPPTSSIIGILVYMWVKPSLRGCRIGDYLLHHCVQTLRSLHATHMLLVHDDNGSGKLVNYYQQRGFHAIFTYLDKAMIGKL